MTLLGVLRPHRTLKLAARWSTSRALAAHGAPRRAQERVLGQILALYRDTELGRSLRLGDVRSIADLRRVVPVTEKNDYAPWAARLQRENPRGLVTKDALRYLATSSGTTGDARYFPFPSSLIRTFRRFQWEATLYLMDRTNNFGIFDGNILVTGPTAAYETLPSGVVAGRATSIMTELSPRLARSLVRPPRAIHQMTDAHAKIEATVADALAHDIRMLTGVPLVVLPLFERILAGARAAGRPAGNLAELWPDLSGYLFSGAPIDLLEPRLREIVGPRVPFFEVYSASEGPVAYQHRLGERGMLLALQHTFFEFQRAGDPLDAPRLTADEVEPGTPYRILITTTGGKFCYRLGDLVEFTSTRPLVLRILGRESEELNLGYERIPVHVVKEALARASREAGAQVHNFFVCPVPGSKPAHEWHVELGDPAPDPETFARAIDDALQAINVRYADARKGDHLLGAPSVVAMSVGTIERFLLARREYGLGKFLPLFGTREAAGPVLEFAASAA